LRWLADNKIREQQKAKERYLFTERYSPLIVLQKLSYWGRLWIVPEVTLAKNLVLHCGDRRMSWNAMEPALKFLRELATGPGDNLEEVPDFFFE